ncbi:MAG: peroxiredoxin [Pseudomonadota bacterium]
MNRRLLLKGLAGSGLVGAGAFGALPAHAALDVGDKAPDFSAQGSLGGKVFRFSLSETLKAGPVILYFYPAAFSSGCTIEANQFAQATDEFKSLGATVVGVSHDDIETLNRFSVTECRSKFAVLADTDQAIMKAYDAVLMLKPEYANRVSYVIAPNGTIAYQYTSLNPFKHVTNTMTALKSWKIAQQKA